MSVWVSEWVSEWVSDKVTYWAVLDSKKGKENTENSVGHIYYSFMSSSPSSFSCSSSHASPGCGSGCGQEVVGWSGISPGTLQRRTNFCRDDDEEEEDDIGKGLSIYYVIRDGGGCLPDLLQYHIGGRAIVHLTYHSVKRIFSASLIFSLGQSDITWHWFCHVSCP